MSDQRIKNIVILGGGSAGWLTAGVIAAEHVGLRVTVLESPNIPPVGVGEGTWPSMRTTLSKMGVSETDFFRECDASFKQGIKFVGWVTGADGDHYYHPLELPRNFNETDLVGPWQEVRDQISFADAVCFQNRLCERNLAPKQISTPEYAAVANYAYHFSSAKLGRFLAKHCTEKLAVTHIPDDVIEVISAENGDIKSLRTKANGEIHGDLFIDCSGMGALLLGKHYQVPYKSRKDIIFNDTAIAVQVPYATENSPIPSHTLATAQTSGWIWDIGLATRRGVGHVYSSAHTNDDDAIAALRQYLEGSIPPEKAEALRFRKISYTPGHREKLWCNNCVAVGMSAGFVEPLEATALVMIEASARMISDELPATRDVMDIIAKRFNQRLLYYWDTTIDFLKLQYVLTKRQDSDYWLDCVRDASVPDSLEALLCLWKRQAPGKNDFPLAEEMLPAASWQYILYGMGFSTDKRRATKNAYSPEAFTQYLNEVKTLSERYMKHLPGNRELIEKINRLGLQKI